MTIASPHRAGGFARTAWRAFLCLLPFLLAGCDLPSGEGAVRWTNEFEYFRRGGLCATEDGGGMCELRVVVRDDGTWSARGVPTPADTSGTLPIGAASELAAIFDQSWRYFTEVPFMGTCPMAYDGQEYGYVVRRTPYGPGAERADASVREVGSCTYDLERYDSLVKRNMIETAWLVVKPPELEDVEFR